MGASFPSLLYTHSVDATPECTLTGQITHKISPAKLSEDLAGTDNALEDLKRSLASAEKVKQSHQWVLSNVILLDSHIYRIKLLPDAAGLLPSKSHASASLRQPSTPARSFMSIKKNKLSSKVTDTTISSLPSSPSMASTRPPVVFNSKSKASHGDEGSRKPPAIRSAAVHLLATKALPSTEIAQKLNVKKENLDGVLEKIANRSSDNQVEWDLKDRAFKEIDVWTFRYPEADRKGAIKRAVEAFDRMRLDPHGQHFERLLPKDKRGKGDSLSKFKDLGKGPMKQNGTPQIQIQHHDATSTKAESDRSRRLHVENAKQEPERRSVLQDASQKRKPSEKEARLKRLSKNEPKDVVPAGKKKRAEPLIKRGSKKVAPLSSEFVHDSDEEDGFEEAVNMEIQSPHPDSSVQASAEYPGRKENHVKSMDTLPKPDAIVATNGVASVNQNTLNDKSEASRTSAKRGALDQDTRDVSEVKSTGKRSSARMQSPPGSSPPMNASYLGGRSPSASSSSSPLISSKDMVDRVEKPREKPDQVHMEQSRKRKFGKPDQGHNASMASLSRQANGIPKNSKRPKTGELTPPSSDSTSPPAKSARIRAIEHAEDFKNRLYPQYERLHRELEGIQLPSAEKVAQLEEMRQLVADTKRSLAKEFETLESNVLLGS